MGQAKHPFTDVDVQPDPGAWIGALDRVREDPTYVAYKRRLAEILDPKLGGRYLEVGCGTGSDAIAFGERFGVEVVGVSVDDLRVSPTATPTPTPRGGSDPEPFSHFWCAGQK